MRLGSSVALLALATFAQGSLLLFDAGSSDYKLAGEGLAPAIFVSGDDDVAVHRTAQDLADDFGRVVGTNGTVSIADGASIQPPSGKPIIIAGTIGSSTLIDNLISGGQLEVSAVEGKWESYTSQLIKSPTKDVPWALVIAGSDRRGAIYGLYDISETMGVSPWYWWADVPIKTKTGIWVSEDGKVQGEPSVKYRGFFINDEAPALQGWVADRWGFTEYGHAFVGDFYRLVFELCLRLKGNYIWPAMWGRMFYVEDPENGQIAHDYGVVMGTSHHEPMARSEREQQLYKQGNWDWISNRDNITTFFKEGIERALNWETFWTMGMRGSGDVASPTLTAPALEDLIKAQQALLLEYFNSTDPLDIPQTWVLYKEVGEYYKAGLDVPDSVTLLWTDDNSGNMLRVPIANETNRAAGAGVYYHFDYVGGPRSYKWINSIQLVKTWEQMKLAYERNARQIWIANVGDIKPLEIPLTHFMDMAYDMNKYDAPESTTAWIKRWAATEFGKAVGDATAEILNEYGILLGRRKYELLSDLPYAFSVANYDEAERHLAQWEALLEKTTSIYESLDAKTQISYFQMIMHPVLAGKTVVDLYTKVALNAWYASQGRVSTNDLAAEAYALFAKDAEITDLYHDLNGGKWNHFVNQVHIGYTSWNDPASNIMPRVNWTGPSNGVAPGIMGVAIQGSSTSFNGDTNPMLLPVDPYLPKEEKRYLDIYARKNGTFDFTITSNASYVSVSKDSGTITAPGQASDVRSFITVDWNAAPEGLSTVSLLITPSNASSTCISRRSVKAILPVNKTSVPKDFSGHVESNGVVSVEAAHFSDAEARGGLSYVEIPHYGRTLSAVKLWPVTAASQTAQSGPALKYSLYTTSATTSAKLVVMLGTALNHDPTRPLKYAFSLDGGAVTVVQPVPNTPMYTEPQPWRNAIVGGGWTSTTAIEAEVAEGAHELSIWLLEPGVVLQKVVLDVGGFKPSALGPPESRRV